MKEKNSYVNIEGNKNCQNISVTINQLDDLSYENIEKNCDIANLENNFNKRIEFSKNVLTKSVLPKQLQHDFEVVPNFEGNKFEYKTLPKTEDAYEKFPMKTNFTMQFENQEEAKKFKESGIHDLLKIADETQKPVEIPNIIEIKEFLGDFEDPNGYANKYGSEGIKLYICPSPLPKPQKYSIELFNNDFNFNLITELRVNGRYDDKIILTNDQSKNEKFNVKISILNIKDIKDSMEFKFNLSISLREKYNSDCESNRDTIIYSYLMEDSTCSLIVKSLDEDITLFNVENCGNIKHTKKQLKGIKKLVDLINKILIISKVKEINIYFNIDEILKSDNIINILYSNIFKKTCIIKEKIFFDYIFIKNEETKKFCEIKSPLYIESKLESVSLFGNDIKLSENVLRLDACKIFSVEEDAKSYRVKIESTNTKIITTKKIAT